MSDEGIKEVTCERREPKNPGSDVTRSFTLSALYPFASQTGTGRETGPFGPPFGLTARPAARMGADKGRA